MDARTYVVYICEFFLLINISIRSNNRKVSVNRIIERPYVIFEILFYHLFHRRIEMLDVVAFPLSAYKLNPQSYICQEFLISSKEIELSFAKGQGRSR